MNIKSFYIVIFFLFSFCKSQVKVSGIIISEEGKPLSNVSIYINGILKAHSNLEGLYNIESEPDSEIFFLKNGYDAFKMNISLDNIQNYKIILRASEFLIEEVEISNIKISGNLKKDVLQFKRNDKVEKLQKDIGLPKSPEKPREIPPELVKDVLIPLLGATICLEDVYKVVSGDSKRMKRLYKYQDMLDDVDWLESNIDIKYFNEINIPPDRIREFLEFSLITDKSIKSAMKENNTSKILLKLEVTSANFKNKLRLQK